MSITIEQVMSWRPCYSRKRVVKLFAGRETLTITDILDLPIPPKDRLWAVLREDCLPATILHEFACRCAEHLLAKIKNPDSRSVAAIAAKRAWLQDAISEQDLAAAWDAACAATWAATDAVWDAALAATWAVAPNAAWAAVKNAAMVAASTAEKEADDAATEAARNEQIELLREMLA